MIIISGLPVPPSANNIYHNRVTRKANNNRSKLAFAISRRKSPELELFYAHIHLFRNQNSAAIEQITEQLHQIIDQGFVLSVDIFVSIKRSDMMTKGEWKGRGQDKRLVGADVPHGVDANNYVKAAIDGLTKLTDVDDKYILSGTFEKVICETKELECTTLVIRPHKVRTFQEIKSQLNMAT